MVTIVSKVQRSPLTAALAELRAQGLTLLGAWWQGSTFTLATWDRRQGVLTERPVGPGPFPSPSAEGFPSFWDLEHALSDQEDGFDAPREVEVFGRGVHTLPLGPVRADVSESLRYELSVLGDEIHHVRLWAGFKRRHVLRALSHAALPDALAVAERVTGTARVAHALAFSQAVEASAGYEPAPEALALRSLLAELERLYTHLGDLASLAQATGTLVAAADLLRLKDQVLRHNSRWTGHRYLAGSIAPGGVARPLRLEAEGLGALVRDVRREFSAVRHALDHTNSFLDRLHGCGRLPADLLPHLDLTGFCAKSAGVPADVRWERPYAAYGELVAEEHPCLAQVPDAYGRYAVRAEEVLQSLALLERLAQRDWEARPASLSLPPQGVGYGLVEAARGRLFYRVEIQRGRTGLMALRTPSALHWSLVPLALANGNILQDFPIVDASFSLSVSALDL